MDSPARITDVAEAAGVSATTVSNVVNRPHKVAAGTREKVQKVIQTLKYVPNPNAAALPKSRQKQDPSEVVTCETVANSSRPQTRAEVSSDTLTTATTGSSEESWLDWERLQGGELIEIVFRDRSLATGLVDAVMPSRSLIWLWMDNGHGRTLVMKEDVHRLKLNGS
jgi:hypothetical protein